MAIVAQVTVPIDGGLLLEELREEVVMRLHICLVLVMPDFEQVEAQLVIQMPLHFELCAKNCSSLASTHLGKDQIHHWPSWW